MYTTFYQLSGRPFENTPDPNFLYLAKQHREVLYSLIYGIESGKGFILLTGEIGTGKTTIIRALLKKISPMHLVFSVVNPHVGFADIFGHLSRKLALAGEGQLGLDSLECLTERLITLRQEGKKVALIIDEAHLLTEETLEGIRLLSNIEDDQAKLLQIILVGQNEVYALLARASQRSLQQRIVVNRQLRPLSWDETKGYIAHRLAAVGREAELFDRQAVAMIWRASGGIPRLISQLCDNALITGYAVEAPMIGRSIIQEVLDDMGPMRPKTPPPFFCLPLSAWPSWSFVVGGLAFLLLGLGIVGLLAKDNRGSQTSALAATKSAEEKATLPDPPPLLAEAEVVVPTTVVEAAPTLPSPIELEDKVTGAPSLAAVTQPDTKAHIITPNETVSALAFETYGVGSETILDLIQIANQGLANINQLKGGQTLLLPVITRESMLMRGEDGRFHIHYASFHDLRNAQRVSEGFKSKGLDSFFLISPRGDSQVFRVYVGSFTEREEAKSLLNTIDFKNLPFLNSEGRLRG